MQEHKSAGRKNPPARPLGAILKVKPQAKKAKLDQGGAIDASNKKNISDVDKEKSSQPTKLPNADSDKTSDVVRTGLVSYSDESDEDV